VRGQKNHKKKRKFLDEVRAPACRRNKRLGPHWDFPLYATGKEGKETRTIFDQGCKLYRPRNKVPSARMRTANFYLSLVSKIFKEDCLIHHGRYVLFYSCPDRANGSVGHQRMIVSCTWMRGEKGRRNSGLWRTHEKSWKIHFEINNSGPSTTERT